MFNVPNHYAYVSRSTPRRSSGAFGRRTPGGADPVRVDNEARALMARMADLSSQLRNNCDSFNLVDSAACSNSADEIDAWLADRGPRLLAQSEAGDDARHQALVDFCHKMMNFLSTAYDDISSGLHFSDVVDSVEQTVEDDANKAKKAAFPVGAILAALAAGVIAIKVL